MRLVVWICLGLLSISCKSAMTQQFGGVSHVIRDGTTAGTIGLSVGAGDTHDGNGMAVTAQLMANSNTVLLREEAQLQVVGVRRGMLRLFGRLGLGFNLGWMEGEFGGGASTSAELGTAIGRGRDVFTVHASVSRIGRFGEAPGATLLGLHLGWAMVWRKHD